MTDAIDTEDIVEIRQIPLTLADGRRVAVWRTGGDRAADPRRVAIVAQGFARRMRHMAAVSRYLVDNGFVVYRADYVDHVGLSDGGIWGFRISAMHETLAALHEHVREAEGVDEVVFVTSSLSTRPVFRLAAERSGIAGIVGIVGVVDTRYTLERVFGEDHSARALEDWGPEDHVTFESKKIHSITFSRDWTGGRWLEVADTEADLAKASCPVVNFCGSSDDWVDVAEVKRVFASGEGDRRVVELPFVEHELSRNPVAAQTILREVTRTALLFAGAPDAEVAETSFTTLAAQIPYERGVESEALEAEHG